MTEQTQVQRLEAREFAARLAANKFVTASENRLRAGEQYEAFDFLVKRPVEAEAFGAANFAETDALLRRGVCVAVSKRVKTDASAAHKDAKTRVAALIESAQSVDLLRKGLKKFFEPDYSELQAKKLRLADNGKPVHSVELDAAAPYTMYVTRKEDGENAQLSYSAELGKFVFGSKHYTLTAADSEELASYTHVDAAHCLAIARFLMAKIEALEPDKLQRLKELLAARTLIGEYVGDAKFAHVVRYSQTAVKFFCASAKDRFTAELDDIDETAKTLREFGLDFVHYDRWSKDSREVFDVLHEMAFRAANMPFKDAFEGFVVYIFTGGRDIVLKFKSLAYKSEKLFLSCEDGIKRLSDAGDEGEARTPDTHAAAATGHLTEYHLKQLSALELDGLLKSKLVALLNGKLAKLVQKAQQFDVFLKPTIDAVVSDFFSRCLAVVHKCFVRPSPTFFNQRGQMHVLHHRKPIIVLVPMSIPGCGKSYYGEHVAKPYCEQRNYHFTSVSSDRIRNTLIQEYMDSNNMPDSDLSFKRTDRKASQAFKAEFYNALRLAMEDSQPRAAGYVIFRDRNHPSLRQLESIVNEVKSALRGFSCVFVLMVPKKMAYLNQGLTYEDLFRCLYRVKNRRNHETLPYKGFDTFMTIMYNCYVSFRSVHKTELDYDGIVEYYVEEEFSERCKDTVAELIEIFKDYNQIKRDKKPVAEKNLQKIRERYVDAIEKLEIVPKDFEPFNRDKVRLLGEEVEQALKHNYKSLEVLITESNEFLVRECVEQLRHSVEQHNLPDFNDMLRREGGWKDVERLSVQVYRAGRDKAENARRLAEFRAETRVPTKLYIIVYIPQHEVQCYALRQHKVFMEVKAPRFELRRRDKAPLDQDYIDGQVVQFAQHPENGYFMKLEPEVDGAPLTIYLYRLKNERILDGLCNVNYS